jgi:hypothetical protein
MAELNAIQRIAEIVADLTPAERRRVSAWLSEYAFQDECCGAGGCACECAPDDDADASWADGEAAPGAEGSGSEAPADGAPTYDSFAELYAAVAPRKGAQKAAVAGWWIENKMGQGSWKAYEVNKLLKSIEVKVSSMSIVLTNAVKAEDPLVVELERLGEGERARKVFCLSESGREYVQSQLG